MRICFLLGSPDISGGTYVIFQHALFLQKECKCNVDIVPIFEATKENTEWHPEAQRFLRFISFEDASNIIYDVAVATWWKTVIEIPRINAKHYIYFVQSIESWFYSVDEVPLRKLVDSTYGHGLPVITEASWIKRYLYTHYSTLSWLVVNGVRKDIYKPYGDYAKRQNRGLRVLVEGPVNVEFKNVPRTIELCKKAGISEIWLLTSTDITDYKDVNKVFSRVPITSTPYIYRSCDLIVKLSYIEGMFGPPLEMFHCGGTAIVYNVTGHDEYIRHNINGLVAKKDDEKIVIKYLKELKDDTERLNELKFEAQRTAFNWPDWTKSSSDFFKAIKDIATNLTELDKISLFESIKMKFVEYVNEENRLKSVRSV